MIGATRDGIGIRAVRWIALSARVGCVMVAASAVIVASACTELPNVANAEEAPAPLYLPVVNLSRPMDHVIGLDLVGQIGGAGLAIDVNGPYAYVGHGPRMLVVNVQQPDAPRIIGRTQVLPSVIRGLDAEPPYVFAAVRGHGVHVIDVSSPSAPEAVALSEFPGNPTGIVVRDRLAYVASSNEVLVVLDVSNPVDPIAVSMLWMGDSWVEDLFVDGDYAYVAQSDGVRVVDISQPLLPRSVGHIAVRSQVRAVHVSDDVAYVAATHAGLRLYDVSDPARPVALEFLDRDDATDPEYVEDIQIVGGLAYLADNHNGLRVVDVSRRGAPVDVSELDAPGESRRIFVDWPLVYAATNGGLRAFDVTEARRPRQVGLVLEPGYAADVEVVGDTAYIVDEELGLWSIDVSDAAAPVALDHLEVAGRAWYLVSEESVTCVTTNEPRMHVIDTTDPRHLRHVSDVDVGWNAKCVDVSDGVAYLAGVYGLSTVDVRDLELPQLMGTAHSGKSAEAIRRFGDLAVVVEGDSGLSVYDVSTPRAPRHVSNLPNDGEYHRFLDVDEMDGLVYVTDLWEGIRILDVSEPQDPRQVGFLGLPRMSVSGLDVVDGQAYVSASTGIAVAHIADTSAPYVEYWGPVPGENPSNVVVAGQQVYVAAWWGGLQIYRLRFGQ